MAEQSRKKRGIFLTTMISFHLLGFIGIVYIFFFFLFNNLIALENFPIVNTIYIVVITLASALSLYGVLTWKKWGFNLFLFIYTINLIIQFALLNSYFQLVIIFWSTFSTLIYLWAIHRKWAYFE